MWSLPQRPGLSSQPGFHPDSYSSHHKPADDVYCPPYLSFLLILRFDHTSISCLWSHYGGRRVFGLVFWTNPEQRARSEGHTGKTLSVSSHVLKIKKT